MEADENLAAGEEKNEALSDFFYNCGGMILRFEPRFVSCDEETE